MDRTIRRVTASGAEGEVLQEVNILDKEGSYLHVERPPSGARVIASVIRRAGNDALREKYSRAVWDVRVLGLVPTPFPTQYVYHDWNRVFYLPEWEVAFGPDENEVEVTSQHGVKRISLDPAKGGFPKRIETVSASGTVRAVDVELKKWVDAQGDSVWFPVTANYTVTRDGVASVVNECKVTEAEFRIAIPDRLFSLSGLSLGPGHVVRVLPPRVKKTMQWDGNQLVPYSPQAAASDIDESGRERLKLIFGVVGLVLMGTGVLLLFTRRSNQRAG